MATLTYDRMIGRADELQGDRETTENTWQRIADNMLGRRDFTVLRTRGQQRMQRIYDDTSKVSSSLLSGAIHSLMTGPFSRWFEYRFENPRLQEDDEASDWLKLAERRIYAALGAPQANFNAQLAETYIDLINFGTGAIFIDDVPGVGVQFSTRPLQELYLAEDPSGRIDTIVRRFNLSARQAVELWGNKAESAFRSVQAGKSEGPSEYIHMIMPNDDVILGNIDITGMPWASVFISPTDKTILEEGGYQEMPMATPRWEKDPGEVYGRGPGWNALSNQMMLNEMNRVKIVAGQLNINPPVMIDSALPGDLNFNPGARIFVDTVMGSLNPPIQPILLGGDPRMTSEDIIDKRKAVQDSFHHQLIETIRDPRMTATQVIELSAQMQRHLAPILGRLQTELLEPLLDRVFAIEMRAGRLPLPIPDIISDTQIKVNYVNPIAKSQTTSDATAIIDFSRIVGEVGQMIPSALHIYDADNALRELAEALGVPPSAIRDSDAVEVIRQGEAQLAQEQQAKQDAVTATDQIAKVAKAVPQAAA